MYVKERCTKRVNGRFPCRREAVKDGLCRQHLASLGKKAAHVLTEAQREALRSLYGSPGSPDDPEDGSPSRGFS